MKNYLFVGIMSFLVVIFVLFVVWYGETEVAFKIQGETVYRQIKNGLAGANCFDENGVKVTASSRVAGPEWIAIASLEEIPDEGKTFSITCYPYASVSDAPPVSAVVTLLGRK